MDIQDLKNAQEERLKKAEIEASEQKYRGLAEAIPQIVWTSPYDGYVNYFNQQWYGFTGIPNLIPFFFFLIKQLMIVGIQALLNRNRWDMHIWVRFIPKIRICGQYTWNR